MAPPTSKRGGRYATTYDYTAAKLGIHRPYLPAENRIVKALVEAALESGISHSDAVKLAIGVYKEIDTLARDERSNLLSRTALKDIRVYCRAILRSGTTFSAFEIATRAVATWRMVAGELKTLHEEWDRESVTKRLKRRAMKKQLADQLPVLPSGMPAPPGPELSELDLGPEPGGHEPSPEELEAINDVAGLYDDFEELQRLDYESSGGARDGFS